MSAERQSGPIFTVEGRIGGRWWAWQRFRERDAAAYELARLAAERRFDGVRMSLTIPGRDDAPPFSRDLVVIDGHGVRRPDERPFAAAEPIPPARAAHAPRAREILAQLAARASDPASRTAGPPPIVVADVIDAVSVSDATAYADPSYAEPADRAVERARAFVRPPTAYAADAYEADGRADPRIGDDPPYLTAEDTLPEEEPSDYLLDPAYADRPPPERKRRIPRQFVYTVGAGVTSLLLAVASYETTRLLFGMPDLLEEARATIAGIAGGTERPIVAAARAGRGEEVAKLLKGGFSPNSDDRLGVPAPATMAQPEPEAAIDPRAYASIMHGLTWRETLAAVKASAKECREVGRRYIACELKVRPWLDDIETVEAWFDRSDGDRFVSIEARSVELVDYSVERDGAAIRARFDQIHRAIDQHLPPGLKPIVSRQAPKGMPFFESLKPGVDAGEFSAFWSDDGRRRPASVQLKLTGIAPRKGRYLLVISNPQRLARQQAATPSK